MKLSTVFAQHSPKQRAYEESRNKPATHVAQHDTCCHPQDALLPHICQMKHKYLCNLSRQAANLAQKYVGLDENHSNNSSLKLNPWGYHRKTPFWLTCNPHLCIQCNSYGGPQITSVLCLQLLYPEKTMKLLNR